MYFDDGERDEIDDAFDELDKIVELAQTGKSRQSDGKSFKYDCDFATINLMIEEVNSVDIKIYQQMGDSWIAEVKYKGIVFICVAGKHKPEEWESVNND